MNEEQFYIELFHGRKDPNQEMDDWGEPGPVFGPLRFVHTTYARHVKLGLPAGDKREVADLFVTPNDLVYYDGVYYGDWSVFQSEDYPQEDYYAGRHQIYDRDKANIPGPSPKEEFAKVVELLGNLLQSEDATGCTPDLTVVSAPLMEQLRHWHKRNSHS